MLGARGRRDPPRALNPRDDFRLTSNNAHFAHTLELMPEIRDEGPHPSQRNSSVAGCWCTSVSRSAYRSGSRTLSGTCSLAMLLAAKFFSHPSTPTRRSPAPSARRHSVQLGARDTSCCPRRPAGAAGPDRPRCSAHSDAAWCSSRGAARRRAGLCAERPRGG